MEFSGVLVFALGVSKGSNTILWNFQGWSFVLSGISRSKEKKINSKGFSKKYVLNSPCLVFSQNGPMSVDHKNFRFTPIPDKPDDFIFLKSPKTLFLDHF